VRLCSFFPTHPSHHIDRSSQYSAVPLEMLVRGKNLPIAARCHCATLGYLSRLVRFWVEQAFQACITVCLRFRASAPEVTSAAKECERSSLMQGCKPCSTQNPFPPKKQSLLAAS